MLFHSAVRVKEIGNEFGNAKSHTRCEHEGVKAVVLTRISRNKYSGITVIGRNKAVPQ